MALPIDTIPGSVLSGFGFALEEHGCLFEQLPVCDVINPSYSCVYKIDDTIYKCPHQIRDLLATCDG